MQGGDILKLKTMQIDDNKNYIYLFIDLVDVLKTIYNIKIYFMNNISFSLILNSRRSAKISLQPFCDIFKREGKVGNFFLVHNVWCTKLYGRCAPRVHQELTDSIKT